MYVTDPPIPPAALSRAVLRWRQHVPAAGLGAHVRRRQGHSLEFREYRAYQRGDDIRTVDWRASARLPRRSDLLVRSFEAEQKLTLAVVLDNRPDMRLPAAMPKLLYGLWALRALCALALDQGDEVVLARLFAGQAPAIVTLRGAPGQAQARAWAEAIWHEAGDAATPAPQPGFADLTQLARRLRPAGAVIIISDMLFDDPEHRFLTFARAAQARRRSLSVLELDTLPHETELLRREAEFRLIRPGQSPGDGAQLFDETGFAAAADAVATHLQDLRQAVQAGGLDWPVEPVTWPADPSPSDTALKSHFSQSFPRLPMLAGLSLGSAA